MNRSIKFNIRERVGLIGQIINFLSGLKTFVSHEIKLKSFSLPISIYAKVVLVEDDHRHTVDFVGVDFDVDNEDCSDRWIRRLHLLDRCHSLNLCVDFADC